MEIENNSLIRELNSRIEDYSSFLDMVDSIFVVIDEFNIIRLVNQKALSILGYKKEEVLGKTPLEFVAPSVKDSLNDHVDSLFNGNIKPDVYIEFPFTTKNNLERIIRCKYDYLKDSTGKVVYILVSGEDVTEKKREEKVQAIISRILFESDSEVNIDELFRFIHSSVKQVMPADNFYIALYEKENNEIRFAYFIDQFDKIAPTKRYGKGLTEYIIKSGHSLLLTEDDHMKLESEGKIELLGSPSKIWLGVPLVIKGHVIGALVVQDYKDAKTYGVKEKEILEHIAYPTSRAIERKLVEREREDLISRLKKLNESKDGLFSLISHDLRSPFNSLLGFSEILATEYDTLSREEIKEYLSFIYDTSKNLYGMTTNLLQFSRFQMGRIDYDPEPLDIKALLTHSLNILRGNTIKKQINIISSVPDGIKVNADEDMLKSILQNLLSNAIKFTGRGGDIFISVNRLDGTDTNKMLQIVIRDTGVGITEDLLENLFKDHVQSSPGTDREYGSGLGLLLVKEFIETNGGTISVTSKLNQGSTFTFTLPLTT
jgi:PAS domain S-box-containing protein